MREQRLVFGEDAELYDSARPTYPTGLANDVVAFAGGRGRAAVDVGCGTGKATVLLAERGLGGVGVEADPAMAEVARRNLASFPAWRVEVSDFEKWEPAGNGLEQFDLVCSAQAWHWLDPAVRLHKAYALLRPGGWVALWWNRPAEDGENDGLSEEIDGIYAEVAPDIASKNSVGRTGEPASEQVPPELSFGAPVSRCYRWETDYSAGEWTALMRTQSDHRLLDAERLDELTRKVEQAIEKRGGTYRHQRACWLWAAQKQE